MKEDHSGGLYAAVGSGVVARGHQMRALRLDGTVQQSIEVPAKAP